MKSCELCKFHFIIRSRLKPFKDWSNINNVTSSKSKKKLFVDVFLYFLAIVCNVWTLTSFFDIILNRFRESRYDWVYFSVLALSFTSLVGIFCFTLAIIKEFHKLIYKWIQFNRILRIQPITIV
jgi:E3 ubiquitin-protein ligase MARCH1/8